MSTNATRPEKDLSNETSLTPPARTSTATLGTKDPVTTPLTTSHIPPATTLTTPATTSAISTSTFTSLSTRTALSQTT